MPRKNAPVLTEPFDPSKPLFDDQEEVFALSWVAHRNGARAYREATGKTPEEAPNARILAYKDWFTRVNIKARIEWLREEFKKRAKLDVEWLEEWLEEMITGLPQDAAPDSQICQRVMTKCGVADLPCDKLGAFDRYAKMRGLNPTEKLELSGNIGFRERLDTIREKK